LYLYIQGAELVATGLRLGVKVRTKGSVGVSRIRMRVEQLVRDYPDSVMVMPCVSKDWAELLCEFSRADFCPRREDGVCPVPGRGGVTVVLTELFAESDDDSEDI